jgi:hypothetical protein
MEKLHRNSKAQKVTEVVSAKPVRGLPLGNSKLNFYYIDNTIIEFKGFISDVTGLFVNRDVQDDFKRVVLEEISYLKANSFKPIEPENDDDSLIVDVGVDQEKTDLIASIDDNILASAKFEKSDLQKAIVAFKEYDFSKACRVLLLESGPFLHLIVQVGRLNLLTSYAHNPDRSQWSFVRGLEYDFVASGSSLSLPHQQRLRELGEVFMHVFLPDDREENSALDFKVLSEAKVLLPIVPYIPGTVDIDQTLKSMKDEINSKEAALRLARESLAEKATRNDSGKIAVAGFEEYNPDDSGHHSRFDFTDALLIVAPTVLLALLGWSFDPMGWLGGLSFGFPIGFFLVSRRK